MAVCRACNQEMTDLVTCTVKTYDDFPDGIERQRIRYPDDVLASNYAKQEAPLASDWPANCRDCGTPQSGLHHPGCDVESCPRCQWQCISCDCYDEVYD
jgi:hypothetical protein